MSLVKKCLNNYRNYRKRPRDSLNSGYFMRKHMEPKIFIFYVQCILVVGGRSESRGKNRDISTLICLELVTL